MTDLEKWRFLRVELVGKSVYLSRPCKDMNMLRLPCAHGQSDQGIGTVSSCAFNPQAGYFCRTLPCLTIWPEHAV